MNNVRTVSDTKRAFYAVHTRPIHSVYRRVVEELMVEMHLLSVNADFRYDPVYALGVVSSFDCFMQGYEPERDRESIFTGLCRSVEADPQHYRSDAEQLRSAMSGMSAEGAIAALANKGEGTNSDLLKSTLHSIASNNRFKYSRLFAIGLFTLLETADAELVKDSKKLAESLKTIGEGLNVSADKLTKDLELYRSNVDKMTQAVAVLKDVVAADRKKREERSNQTKEKEAAVATADASESTDKPEEESQS